MSKKKAPPKFDLTKVIVLNDRPYLQRMVIAWTKVNHKLKGESLIDDWARLSGFSPRVIVDGMEVLKRHKIIGKKGKVEKEVIAAIVMAGGSS